MSVGQNAKKAPTSLYPSSTTHPASLIRVWMVSALTSIAKPQQSAKCPPDPTSSV